MPLSGQVRISGGKASARLSTNLLELQPFLAFLMSTPAALRHLHLKHIVPFTLPQRVQSVLVNQFLSSKAAISSPSPSSLSHGPQPTILSFIPTPVYTTGRREHGLLNAEKILQLQEPLIPLRRTNANPHQHPEYAEVLSTQRGGQTTFHGPGQVVIYPIMDLKSKFPLWPKGLSVRCYVNLLEQATIDTLAIWGLKGIRTENPGVWDETGERKIAALGVHLRRNVTSYGVGINVSTDMRWFDRIIACGLVGKGVTSMRQLGVEKGLIVEGLGADRRLTREVAIMAGLKHTQDGYAASPEAAAPRQRVMKLKPPTVASIWVQQFAKGLYGEPAFEELGRTKIEKLDRISGLGLVEEEEDAIYEEYKGYMVQAGYLPSIRKRELLSFQKVRG